MACADSDAAGASVPAGDGTHLRGSVQRSPRDRRWCSRRALSRNLGEALFGALAHAESLADDGNNTSADLFDGSRLVEQDDALGLAFGNGAVLLVDATVEVVTLALEAVLVGAVLANVTVVAAAGASERGVERRQQEQ